MTPKPAHQLCSIVSACILAASVGPTLAQATLDHESALGAIRLGLRDVYFVENQGQWVDQDLAYGLKTQSSDVAFRNSSFTLHLAPIGAVERTLLPLGNSGKDRVGPPGVEPAVIVVTFPGSREVRPTGVGLRAARFNYFVGGDGRNCRSDVPSFSKIVYEDLYDGIDLHVMGREDGVLKYEFHCRPGADHARIRIHYAGIDSLRTDDSGNMQIITARGTIADRAPVVWQPHAQFVTDSGSMSVVPTSTLAARFVVLDRHTYGFELLDQPDPTRPLVIDPEVTWMTYLGGIGLDHGNGVAVDRAGNIFVAGTTRSPDFEGMNNSIHGVGDAFVAKVTAAGTLQWMTFLGGKDDDEGLAIAVDRSANVLVSGSTYSNDFEGRNNSQYSEQPDAFVLKVNSEGQLRWMTYLGGEHDEDGSGIATDDAGNALVVGHTASVNFPGRQNETHGGVEAFVAKIGPSGAHRWMYYLGGSGNDYAQGVDVNAAGDALITGYTHSNDFEGRINSFHGTNVPEVFVVKADPSGQLLWMTYLGGTGPDYGHGVAVSRDDRAIVTGYTTSSDFEGRTNQSHGSRDAYVASVSSVGALQWMTYCGGSGMDESFGIAADGAGNALITGQTRSTNFQGAVNSYHGGDRDAFAQKVSSLGEVVWMRYLGGDNDEWAQAIAVGPLGNVLVTGVGGSSVWERQNNQSHGGSDAFLVKIGAAEGPQLAVTAACPGGGPIEIAWRSASPRRQVALFFAGQTGSFRIPDGSACEGTILGLAPDRLELIFSGAAGMQGHRIIIGTADPSLCGGYLQLLDVATCTTSNVARVE